MGPRGRKMPLERLGQPALPLLLIRGALDEEPDELALHQARRLRFGLGRGHGILLGSCCMTRCTVAPLEAVLDLDVVELLWEHQRGPQRNHEGHIVLLRPAPCSKRLDGSLDVSRGSVDVVEELLQWGQLRLAQGLNSLEWRACTHLVSLPSHGTTPQSSPSSA